MTLFLRLESVTTRIALWGAIGFLVIAAGLAMYQVTTRFVFGSPSTWSEVITRSAMIWSVFLGVAPAFREGNMIALEIIQRALPRPLGLGLYLGSMTLTLVFFAILFWQGWAMTERVARQTLAALEVSIAWVYAALPVGSVFILIAVLACMIRAARGDWPEAETPEGAP
ncbi:TRAP transporter small permease [Rhodobaculum claviforme]|uniref:TRAP transporter small permease protein n=1 Tax=Rhodobaculum claviforme TaxID=1549854 RepID=A0A934TM65_9RHOB|nr:TRAP transporter small permease [Rhodobaculum claviforme]MBK5928684.1 TRAP transporter permease DctQ [Rhodobaculum claviforme]